MYNRWDQFMSVGRVQNERSKALGFICFLDLKFINYTSYIQTAAGKMLSTFRFLNCVSVRYLNFY